MTTETTRVEILNRRLPRFRGVTWLVRVGGEYFVVSAADTGDHGPETMAFRADREGKVQSWMDVAVVRGLDHQAVIDQLVQLD